MIVVLIKNKKYPLKRELDGVYFRINRNDKWCNICFSDMTEDEMKGVLKGRNKHWMLSLCVILLNCIKQLENEFHEINGNIDRSEYEWVNLDDDDITRLKHAYTENYLYDKCIDLGKRLKHIGDVYDIQRGNVIEDNWEDDDWEDE